MPAHLHVPQMQELGYRQKHLNEDPATMSYNKGFDLGIPEYDPATGCIAFPKENWASWYERWCCGGERFYAYIERDGVFIGEACLHPADEPDTYEMGIVLEAAHRGNDYAREALELLLAHAFQTMKARAVTNSFEQSRIAAFRLHLACGFEAVGTENGCVRLILTAERYRQLHPTLPIGTTPV